MSYIMNYFICFLIVLCASNSATSQTLTSPAWFLCSMFDVRENATLLASWDDHPASTHADCQVACISNLRCGSYSFSSGWCRLHRISIRLIEEQNLPQGIIASDSTSIVGIKTCSPRVNDYGCTNYPVFHNRTYIKEAWAIASIFPIPYTDLTIDQCYTYCSLFTGCRSVAYWHDTVRGECDLYNTTVGELQALHLYDDYGTDPFQGELPILVTVDRYCGGEAYDPIMPPDFCPQAQVQLSLLHGWYLCAAPNLLSADECHQRNCCYVTTILAGSHTFLCVTNQ